MATSPARALPTMPWRSFTGSIRRGALPLAIAAVVGGAAGFVVAQADAQYKSVVVLGVQPSSDIGLTDALVNSAASTVESDVVIDAAAEKLKVDPGALAQRVSSTVQSGTTLIDLSVTAATPEAAKEAATTVADIALADYSARSAAIADEVRRAGEEQLVSGKLSAPTAENARQSSIGTVVGSAQGRSIEGAVTITVVSPAVNASRAGVSKAVGALLGAAAAVLLTLLVVLSGTWRRRRHVRNVADLVDVRADFRALTSHDVDRISGAVLEAGRATVAVLDTSGSSSVRVKVARPLAGSLARAGVSVGRLTVLDGTSAGSPLTRNGDGAWSVGDGAADAVLGRVGREELPDLLEAHLVLVDLPATGEAAELLHGQSDFLPVIAVEPGTRVAAVEAALEPYAGSDPLVVMVDR